MYTLFILIFSFISSDIAINNEAGWKHTHSINYGQYDTLEECLSAGEEVEVLSYPGLPDYEIKCVKGWNKQEK